MSYNQDQELVEFAELFSDKYKMLSPGTFISKNEKYRISYIELGDAANNYQNVVARVNNTTSMIEINKTCICNDGFYNKDFIYFLIFWCVCILKTSGDLMMADSAAIDHCLKNGKSKHDIYSGFVRFLGINPSRHNIERVEAMKTKLE